MKKKSLTALGMLTVALIVVIALLPIVAANPPKNPNRTVIRIEYTEHSMTIFYSDGWARTYLYGEDGIDTLYGGDDKDNLYCGNGDDYP